MLINRVRSFLRTIVRLAPPTDRPSEADRTGLAAELRPLVTRLIADAAGDEERALRLAQWTAENITNQVPAGKGPRATFEERRGFCGARARLYVEMASCAGLTAAVFSMFDPGMRHTVVQVQLDGRWCFLDPMYGVVFRCDGELLGFEEIRADPEAAVEGIVIIGGTADKVRHPDGTQEPVDHVAKAQSIYSLENLRRVRSFGFLFDEQPVKFYPAVRFSDDNTSIAVDASREHAKVFSRAAAKTFGCHLPNALGATNKKVQHIWTLQDTERGRLYHLTFSISEVSGAGVDVSCVAWGGHVLSGARCRFAAKMRRTEWKISLVANTTEVRLRISSPQRCGWGDALIIDGIAVEAGEQVAESGAASQAPATEAGKNLAGLATRYRRALLEPPRAETLLDYLENKSSLACSLRDGTFYPYEGRPGNWAWLGQGFAAIYAFRVTGDHRFLQWIAKTAEGFARYRDCETGAVDDYRRRQYRSWGAKVRSVKDGGSPWVNEVCTGAGMVLPTALMIWEARRSSDMPPDLLERLEPLLRTCVDVVDEFMEDLVDSPAGAHFVMPHDGKPEPLAHAAPFAALVTVLHAVTGEPRYLDIAKKLKKYFRSAMTVEADGSWSWPYRPTPKEIKGAGEFFFKARVSLYFPLVAHSVGLLFDRDDMTQLARTFNCAVLRDDGYLYPTVSSVQTTPVDDDLLPKYQAKNRLSSLRAVAGFYPLAAFDPEVADKIDQVQQTYPEIFDATLSNPLSAPDLYALRLDVTRAVNPSLESSSTEQLRMPLGPKGVTSRSGIDESRLPKAPSEEVGPPAHSKADKRNHLFGLLTALLERTRATAHSKAGECYHQFSLPKAPLKKVGSPAYPKEEEWRKDRKSYDWTIYDARQLAIMEAYWTRCVSLYLSFLPKRFAEAPEKYYGINSGTFNGAFQKAWMRLGLRMYGIEYCDISEELHAYGCEGEQGDFFLLDHIAPGTFDFAILDRAMFNKPDQAFAWNEEANRYVERTAERHAKMRHKISTPPYFDSMLATVKKDGAFLTILYTNWPEQALRELYAAGAVTLRREVRNRPYLCVMVDRSQPPEPFPTVEDAAALLGGHKLESALSIAESDQTIGKVSEWGTNRLKFHHLPTNHLVEMNLTTGVILSDEIYLNDPDVVPFLEEEGDLAKVTGNAGTTDGLPAIFLLDRKLTGKIQGFVRRMRKRATQRPLYFHSGIVDGSRSLPAALPRVVNQLEGNQELSDAEVIIGVGDRDCMPNLRAGRPMFPEKKAREALELAVRQLKDAGARVTVLLPRPMAPKPDVPELNVQRDITDSYRRMVEELAEAEQFSTVDWGAPLAITKLDQYAPSLRTRARVNDLAQKVSAYCNGAAASRTARVGPGRIRILAGIRDWLFSRRR